MAGWNLVTESLSTLKRLRPSALKVFAQERLSTVVLGEISRSRKRVGALEKQFPQSNVKDICQRLIDNKKALAGMVGGVTGVFGLAALPADALVVAWLELGLLVDIATAYKVNLKADSARHELIDLYSYASGIGPLRRTGPRLLGKVLTSVLEKGGLKVVGRAVPLVAAPVSAYFNNQHMQELGDEAVRHYEGFGKAQAKSRSSRSEG